ncbi:Abi family protein [Pseudomonas prosekii]|uniref:Abortive phage infection protein n=1 Tax=Pseudomonas prosekii TaxID=1148509 RepID=A0A2U2D2D2_9PSED|nr:Abi family protein [Pseudomonas prosekii]PWE40580.1 abortive phage infection protein [Pseudomonas prosekii]
MQIHDPSRAERKLAQLGYYRLSGYWYPARRFEMDGLNQGVCPVTGKPLRLDTFQAATDFDSAVALYNFDKRLRMLVLDAVERLEVHLKTVIAHEVGYHDPMAYTNPRFILQKWTQPYTDRNGRKRNKWVEWSQKQQSHIERSREDCIQWHFRAAKSIPVWVATEAWDFGDLSEFFELLSSRYQNLILARLGLDNARMFSRWMQQISHLRNRCAHHTRIWNQASPNPLAIPEEPYFQALGLDQYALRRLYGAVAVIWFLLRKIAPASTWISDIADLIDKKPAMPGCTFRAMGFADEDGFPRQLFAI